MNVSGIIYKIPDPMLILSAVESYESDLIIIIICLIHSIGGDLKTRSQITVLYDAINMFMHCGWLSAQKLSHGYCIGI